MRVRLRYRAAAQRSARCQCTRDSVSVLDELPGVLQEGSLLQGDMQDREGEK